ncbi:MAG: energy transducer TonB [Myxococcales bacterium]|nr:energy transducer TonB [Myxococcales bacterium]
MRVAWWVGAAAVVALSAAPVLRAEPRNPYLEGASVLGVDGLPAGPSVEDRLAEIRRRLQEVLIYPPIARKRGVEGVTRIHFSIGPDGHAEEIATAASSGDPLLDQAAERSAVDAGELPRILGRLSVPIRFELESR